MPYITQNDRVDFDTILSTMPGIYSAGQLNYVITRICDAYIKQHGLKYQTLNDISGVLTNANFELYRRVAAPYEDIKIGENGDAYTV